MRQAHNICQRQSRYTKSNANLLAWTKKPTCSDKHDKLGVFSPTKFFVFPKGLGKRVVFVFKKTKIPLLSSPN